MSSQLFYFRMLAFHIDLNGEEPIHVALGYAAMRETRSSLFSPISISHYGHLRHQYSDQSFVPIDCSDALFRAQRRTPV